MAEKKYIEIEAAIEAIKSLYPSVPLVKLNIDKWHEKNKAYMECEMAIEALPAADVVPVVRGKWYWDKDGMDWGIGSWRCSECHARPETWWQGDSTNPRNKSGHYFCPNCGAKMEES